MSLEDCSSLETFPVLMRSDIRPCYSSKFSLLQSLAISTLEGIFSLIIFVFSLRLIRVVVAQSANAFCVDNS